MARLSRASLATLAVTGLLLGLGAVMLAFPQRAPEPTAAEPPGFDLQGHRGARGLYPENTLPGFEAALGLGVTTLEMDLGMTRDGVLVVHHDPRLDPERTRGSDGAWLAGEPPALFDLTLAELSGYDVGRLRPGGKPAERFPEQTGLDGVAIPTLERVLESAEAISGASVRYNIEIKTSPLAAEATATPERMAEALVAALSEAGIAERATVQSFDWRSLRHVQNIAPGIQTAYLSVERAWLNNLERGRPGVSPWTAGIDIDDFGGSVPRAVRQAGGAVWAPYYRDLRPPEVLEAQRLGLRVVVWTVNEPADMAALLDLGVDGIITDYPDRLRHILAQRGLPLPSAFAGTGVSGGSGAKRSP